MEYFVFAIRCHYIFLGFYLSPEYINHLFKALNNELLKNSNYSMDKMVKEFQTKGGINAELLMRTKKSGIFKNLNKGFDKIYNRVKKS